MAVADLDEYRAKLASPFQNLQAQKAWLATPAGLLTSAWTQAPMAGAVPTTAVAPTKATAGALDPLTRGPNPAADCFVGAAKLRHNLSSPAVAILCDRLSHQGGLSGIVTGEVTTNLPTAALARYTSGLGVIAGIEIYTIIGTTATTVTCSYTNEAGTAGRTSQPQVIGGTNFREAGRFLPINLQAGDAGVRSVESVTVLATTGTAGAFGVTLLRPLAMIPILPGHETDFNALLGGAGQLTEIVDDACLFWMLTAVNTGAGLLSGTLDLIEA